MPMPFGASISSFRRWRDAAVAGGHHDTIGFVFGAITLAVILAISAALMPFVNIHAGGAATFTVLIINLPGDLAAVVAGDLWEGLGGVTLMFVCNYLLYCFAWSRWSMARAAMLAARAPDP